MIYLVLLLPSPTKTLQLELVDNEKACNPIEIWKFLVSIKKFTLTCESTKV